ncbi:RYamide receptor-like [Bactrocera tryoni]|uniref:RYamide receptor-like n=1 Tax=Bactrocera tryoni TaxID=59916 RepID=UPI001A98F5D8|nr:RYamide receptor-like [Bactrocera tryoni]
MDEFPVVQVPVDEVLEEAEFERLYSAPTGIVVLLSIFYGTISILAVIGNSLVIWVVVTTRQMRTVTNMYIANLAFADVVIGLFCIPFQFQAALLQRWNLPWFMCGFCPFIQALTVNVSVFTLTAIAIDRHRAIINPLRARPTKWVSKLILIGIWLAAFLFATPCAIAFRVEVEHERYRENGIIFNVTRPFCMNKNLTEKQLQTYRYTLVFMQYFVPFCVISFVYIQMAVKLWGTRAPGNAQDTRDITLLRNKKKVIKMLIIVVVVFGLCWLPLQLYNILYVTFPEINEYHFINIIWFCCDWLAMSNSCYNPFIYGIYNEKFKREFNKRFATCFCKPHKLLDVPERTMSMHTRVSSIRSGSVPNSSMRIRTNLHGSVNGNGGSISAAKSHATTANSNAFSHEFGRNENAMSFELTNLASRNPSGIESNNNNNSNSNYNINTSSSNVNSMQLQETEVIAGEHTCVGELNALMELEALSYNAYNAGNST